MLFLLVFSCYCGQGWNNSHAYFLVFWCYWWQSWNNRHALSPRFLLLLWTRLEQPSCFTSSFSVVTVDTVGTIVMLDLAVFSCYCGQGWNNSHALLPRFLLLLVTKLKQQSWFTSSFSLVTVDKVGTTVMLYFLVFCYYWWQSWNNSHALAPRYLLLLATRFQQQSWFISSYSLVTGDKVGTTVMLYLFVFCSYWGQGWNNIMLYFLVFSC